MTADAHRVDAGDAFRAVGDVHRRIQVVHENAHDLAETEGDDGQIIAAQAQCRRAEQYAEQAGGKRAHRQNRPHRPVQAELRRGQQRIGISADGIESDEAQIEQTGEADHDVQPQRQHHIQQREIEHAQPGVAQSRADQQR
jgi:hypothetical protein